MTDPTTTSTSAPTASPEQACGCDDFTASRRRFLAGSGALVGGAMLPVVGDGIFAQASFGAPAGGNVLVVLSLRGGADGLSLMVPHGDADYATARPGLQLPTGSLLAKDATFGLHPSFAPLMPLWDSGRMAAVQGVGMRLPDRSHFSAMEAVEDADPGSTARVGWINRMVGLVPPDQVQQAVHLGSNLPPTALVGPKPTIAGSSLSRLKLPGSDDDQARMRTALKATWRGSTSPLKGAMDDTLAMAARMRPVASSTIAPQNGAAYSTSGLANVLKQTAHLVRARVGTQVVTVDLGGWDTHVGQGVTTGLMPSLIADLSTNVAAFFTDLGALGDTVTVVTLSEFGRTTRENGGGGTDHGYGSAMFLMGSGVRGGYHGRWPGLQGGPNTDNDLAVTTEYRNVLSDVVRSRFPTANLSKVFPGHTVRPAGTMKPAGVV